MNRYQIKGMTKEGKEYLEQNQNIGFKSLQKAIDWIERARSSGNEKRQFAIYVSGPNDYGSN